MNVRTNGIAIVVPQNRNNVQKITANPPNVKFPNNSK